MTDRPVLNWRPAQDPRSRKFPVKLDARTPRSYTWRCDPVLDQGTEGACVGFSIAHEIAARPRVYPVTAMLALNIYNTAKTLDEWPGEAYDGTSVLAGMKAAQRAGYYSGYRWAFDLNDALVAISRQGPVVAGVWWYSGMWEPDAAGYLHKSGQKVGGHAILVKGVNTYGRYVTVHNSWGPDWGLNGEARISWDDFGALIADDGEIALPVRL